MDKNIKTLDINSTVSKIHTKAFRTFVNFCCYVPISGASITSSFVLRTNTTLGNIISYDNRFFNWELHRKIVLNTMSISVLLIPLLVLLMLIAIAQQIKINKIHILFLIVGLLWYGYILFIYPGFSWFLE